MKYQASEKLLGYVKCQCSLYQVLLTVFGCLDILFVLPAMGYANAYYTEKENQTISSRTIKTVSSIFWGVVVLTGFIMPGLMRSMIGIQMVVTAISRLLGLIMSIVISTEFGLDLKVLSWSVATYSVMVFILHVWFLGMHRKSLSSPAPSLEMKTAEYSTLAIFCKTWIPAIVITLLATITMQELAPSAFETASFVICVLGSELTMMPSYFCTMFEIDRLGQAASKEYKEITDDGEKKAEQAA